MATQTEGRLASPRFCCAVNVVTAGVARDPPEQVADTLVDLDEFRDEFDQVVDHQIRLPRL